MPALLSGKRYRIHKHGLAVKTVLGIAGKRHGYIVHIGRGDDNVKCIVLVPAYKACQRQVGYAVALGNAYYFGRESAVYFQLYRNVRLAYLAVGQFICPPAFFGGICGGFKILNIGFAVKIGADQICRFPVKLCGIEIAYRYLVL